MNEITSAVKKSAKKYESKKKWLKVWNLRCSEESGRGGYI